MKKLKALIAALLTVATLSHSKPTQAAVGAIVSTPVLIAGLVIAGGTGVLTIAQVSSCRRNGDSSGLCEGLTLLFGLPIIAIGLILLDGEQGVAFKELSPTQAANLGVSDSDLAVYNSEIDQANMLMNDVKEELAQKKNASEKDSIAAWNALKDSVSPETFATMQKIVSQQQ